MRELQALMWDQVGLLRTGDGLAAALARIRTMQSRDLRALALPADTPFNLALLDWFELRAALTAAESVTLAALNRGESRGAHQRDDFPQTGGNYQVSQRLSLTNDDIVSSLEAPPS